MTLLDEGDVAKSKKSAANAQEKWLETNPLRRWRERQPPEGWSRSLLARQLDVSHTAVALWESGTRLPMADTLAKIERLAGISATQWMDWYERRPKAKEARS
jgi:transcriptional regulator with XRE-family HTH domain